MRGRGRGDPDLSIPLAQLLTGMRGGEKFAAALLRGDVAGGETMAARRAVCRGCKTRRTVKLLGMLGASDWCGEPLVETPTACGCLLAGKTAVGSEKCPQGKW